MPQFEPANFLPQMAWLVLVFAILYFGIVKATLPRLGKAMDDREAKVTGDIATAEQAKSESDKVRAEYEAEMAQAQAAARDLIAKARHDAAMAVEARLAEANKGIEARAEAADKILAEAQAKAAGEVEAVAADAACDIVEKLTGSRPAAPDAQGAVRAALG